MGARTTGSSAQPLHALNLIAGQWQLAGSARAGDSINPANGREIGSFAASAAADGRRAIDAARRAFECGGLARDPAQRARLLLRWADRLAGRADLAQLLTLENGKVLAQSRREISSAIARLRQDAGVLLQAAAAGDAGLAAAQPAGVVAILVAWQAPVALLVASLAPALAAGCSAVVKPARQCAQITAAVIGELAALEELPPGVVNLVSETGQEVARELVASHHVDILCFTGLQETGRKMAQAAAPSGKRLLLDLTGKSCSLVFSDIDVQAVARQLAAAALIAAGQHSSAPRRILVHASCFDTVKAALKRALGQVILGAGDRADCGLGPLIDAPALVAAGVRTERALEHCDEVVLHGRRAGGELAGGYFLSPTLVVERDCAGASSIEEVYGPFLSIGQFETDDEATAYANAMRVARSVSVWTGDAARGERLAHALCSDSILINRHDWLATGGAAPCDRIVHPGRQTRSTFADFLATPRH
ncbi:aldehyde dehydrogenase family protein [Massilia soli]|uniref:Aldehyde dehydrogenase family protein n=1 Tax=Massilia soli TaxID=2792854 RepID=A0ABS7SVW1_9BURK|nr:aldehyde dehydrogenase family protein [Massilia soli]MBZ2210045.1 aldehyde dehydrogenase family protein [Massilia soli]